MNLDPFGNPFHLGFGTSTSDIFKRPRGGAIARPKRPTPTPDPDSGSQPLAPIAEEEAQQEETQDPGEKAVLKNPKWEVEDVGFNEETEISVEVRLPASQSHKTKVEFELFAKTPDGPESISKCSGTILDGKATGNIPVYIPQYKDVDGNLLARVQYYFTAKHSTSDLLVDDTVIKEVDHLADRLIKSHILEDVTFATGKSFIGPRHAAALKGLVKRIAEWKTEHPNAKLAIFGHADAVGDEAGNKLLSERRAESLYAFLTLDTDKVVPESEEAGRQRASGRVHPGSALRCLFRSVQRDDLPHQGFRLLQRQAQGGMWRVQPGGANPRSLREESPGGRVPAQVQQEFSYPIPLYARRLRTLQAAGGA